MRFIDSQRRGKADCEFGWSWEPAPLDDYDLWYALSGEGEMCFGEHCHPIRKGACFLVHPGDRPLARQHPEHRLSVIFIHFQVERPGAPASAPALEPTLPILPERVVYLQETHEFEQLLHRLLELMYEQPLWAEEEFDCLMRQALLTLLRLSRQAAHDGTAAAPSRKQRQAVLRVINRIREAAGRRFTHEELAALVGLTPAYLSKIFKSCTGVSLKAYMTQARLDRAMHLLTETTMNVSQVSDTLGYSTVYLFSKQFKRHFGVPPSAYAHSPAQARPHR